MVSINLISPIKNTVRSLYNKAPSVVVNKAKVLGAVNYVGRKWTSPQQRLAMGATAIVMQPLIDYHNKRVNEDTRKVSVAKTIAKICVGTATGFAIRLGCIKGVKYCSQLVKDIPKDTKPIIKNIKTMLTPEQFDTATQSDIEHYRNAMGTFISLIVMLFTNFAIDAPLTNLFTNKIVKSIDDRKLKKGESK